MTAALMEKYRALLSFTGKQRLEDLNIWEEGGKLHIRATAPFQMEKDLVWEKIRSYADWGNEVEADIKVKHLDVYGRYLVQPGDSLSTISKRFLGSADRFAELFQMNKHVLTDPHLLKPGQVLQLPNK